jgi:hypothetical protein
MRFTFIDGRCGRVPFVLLAAITLLLVLLGVIGAGGSL